MLEQEQLQSVSNTQHRERLLLQAVAEASNRLLAPGDYKETVNSVIAILGQAAGVGSVGIFESHPHPHTGDIAFSIRFEWVKSPTKPEIHNPHLQNLPARDYHLERWYEKLSAGEIINDLFSQLPLEERDIIEHFNIRSLLHVPIVVAQQFWGFISFTDLETEREWTEAEVRALQTMAASIGAAIQRYQTEEMMRKQGILLQGIALATNRLLEPKNMDAAVNAVLTILGETAGVDRAYIFESHPHSLTGEPAVSYRFEWTQPPLEPQINNPILQDIPWRVHQLLPWHDRMITGEIICGPVSKLAPEEQEYVRPYGVRSLLIVPLFVHHKFWGFVGLDDYQAEREWTEAEIRALQTMAASIGAAIQRHQTEEAMRKQGILLQGIALATNRLLEPGDYPTAIQSALATLGEAVRTDRVYIFENHPHSITGEVAVSQRFEWTVQSVTPQIDNPILQDLPWRAHGMMRWYNELAKGDIISGPVRDFPEIEREALVAQDIRSLLIVPIFIREVFWGYIGFDDCHTERQWTNEEVNALRIMAANVGAGVERHQAEQTLRDRRQLANTLREITTALTSSLDLDAVLSNMLIQAQRIIPYHAANIMLIENGVARIVISTGYETIGLSTEAVNALQFPVDETPILQQMFQSRAPYVCQDIQADPNWVETIEKQRIGSWVGVPIILRGAVVGFFSLHSAEPGFYGSEHIELMVSFVQQAAVAFENANLYQQVQANAEKVSAQLDQLDTLYLAGQSILSALDLEEILRRFAREMTLMAHATSAVICRYDSAAQNGKVQVSYSMPEAPCSDVLFKPAEAVVLNKCLLEQAASGSTFLWSCEELPLAFPENPELNRFLHMLLVVPLFSRGQMTGFVLIGESRPGYDHTPDELRMCELLANHVAIVLEQATLLADIQELESIKSKLIRMASHDLRGPLSRIRMMLDFLEDQLHSVLSIQQQAYFVKLQNAINQIEELITNILSMERIEARHRFTQPVVWQDLISQVVESMSIELMSSKHRLVIECAPNLPVMRADKEDLNRALSNLLGNAIKYTPPGGQITIRAFLQDYGGRPQLYVEVADTGIGIPKEKQKQLFQPFYRAQQAGTENISGMGLGLSIVKSAVEYHNGAVFVISEQGRGSMFGFRLPI